VSSYHKIAAPALAVACLGLGVFAYREHLARVAAEERLLAAQAENTRQAAFNATTQTESPVQNISVGPDESELPRPSTGPVPMPTTDRRGPTPSPQAGSEFRAMMDSPEMQQLMSLRARGNLDARYARLFRQLGLSPTQLQRFQQLLIDKQNTGRDVMAAMRTQGLTPGRENGDQTRALIQNANAEIDAQIKAEFGEGTLAQYQTYEQTLPQRNLVERVQQRLSYSGTTLSEQQTSSLIGILAQTSPASNRSRGPGFGSVSITDAAIAQAQAVLSASQLNALQELQREQQAQAELLRQSRENFNTAPPNPPTGR
jgi:hypothetical protein